MYAIRSYYGSAWFSGEEEVKGTLAPGMYADLAVLSEDYLATSGARIPGIASVLTVMGGKVVYAAAEFARLDPPLPPASPDWSPVARFGGHHPVAVPDAVARDGCGCGNGCAMHGHDHRIAWDSPLPVSDKRTFWGALGCSCFGF